MNPQREYPLKLNNYTMKALGIPQPDAWLIINGYNAKVSLPKPTKHRGTILIYALSEPIKPATFEQFLSDCRHLRVKSHPRQTDFELRGFLGAARLIGCETDEAGSSFAVLESPDELGFVPSSGRLGIFNVAEDPFKSAAELVPVSYSSHTLRPSAPSPPTITDNDESDEPSLVDHFWEGVEQQTHREMKKIGGKLTKKAFSHGSDLLTSLLGGDKPRGGADANEPRRNA